MEVLNSKLAMKGRSKSSCGGPAYTADLQGNLSPMSSSESGAGIMVTLEDGDLWSKFERLTNEMIVTKNGRRMFPVIKIRISGLEPSAFYTVVLEFKQIEQTRWKYINGEWLTGKDKGPLLESVQYYGVDYFFCFEVKVLLNLLKKVLLKDVNSF